MDIYGISEITGVSIRTLKKLEKAGFLNAQKIRDPIVAKIKYNLSHGNPLSVGQLIHLIRNSESRKMILKWGWKIDDSIDQLGDVLGEKMPVEMASYILFAAMRDKEAIDLVISWIVNFIEGNATFENGAEQGHAYLAVRMLADLPDSLLANNAKNIAMAMLNCRKSKKLEGYWHIEDVTRRSLYHRRKAYDL